jgi:hypothetical protein
MHPFSLRVLIFLSLWHVLFAPESLCAQVLQHVQGTPTGAETSLHLETSSDPGAASEALSLLTQLSHQNLATSRLSRQGPRSQPLCVGLLSALRCHLRPLRCLCRCLVWISGVSHLAEEVLIFSLRTRISRIFALSHSISISITTLLCSSMTLRMHAHTHIFSLTSRIFLPSIDPLSLSLFWLLWQFHSFSGLLALWCRCTWAAQVEDTTSHTASTWCRIAGIDTMILVCVQ